MEYVGTTDGLHVLRFILKILIEYFNIFMKHEIKLKEQKPLKKLKQKTL